MNITDPKIEDYCETHSTPPSPLFQDLIASTAEQTGSSARMQVGPLEGRFLSMIAKLCQAKRVIEFGTFTGYSALSFAEALPDGGEVVTLDRDPEATAIARAHWERSPHGKKITLKLGDAHQTTKELAQAVQTKSIPAFDLAFIDADKAGYPIYWEHCFSLLRPNGLILVDNVLWSGRVLNPLEKSDREIVDFNRLARNDSRVEKVMLPIRDGILLARLI